MKSKLEQYIEQCVIDDSKHSSMSVDTLKDIGYFIYQGKSFKIRIQDAILHIIKETYKPLGLWKQNPHKNATSENVGAVVGGKWDRIMTLDTNYSGQDWGFRFCNIFLEYHREVLGLKEITIYGVTISTDKIFIGLDWRDDIESTYKKIKTLLLIIQYNSSSWLIKGHRVYDETMEICRKKMLLGDTAERVFELYINQFFENPKSIEFSTGLGDPRDMTEGSDVWVIEEDGVERTVQIKFSYRELTDDVNDKDRFITRANFSTTSNCTYFAVVTKTKITFFTNDNKKSINNGTWSFSKKSIQKEIEYNNMFDELKNLIDVTGKHLIEIRITKEGDTNSIIYDEENLKIHINYPNEDDKNFKNLIVNKTNELKETLK